MVITLSNLRIRGWWQIRFQLIYLHAVRDWFSGAGLPKVSYADGGNTAVMHIKTADGVEVVYSQFSFDAIENALTKMRISGRQGDIVLELWEDVAPKTVANFKSLASSGFYDGTAFHRCRR